MILNKYVDVHKHEELLEEFYSECQVHKYLDEQSTMVLKAIIKKCDSNGYGFIDVDELMLVTKINENQLLDIIHNKLLNKTTFKKQLLQIVDEKYLLDNVVYIIYSDLAVYNEQV